MNYPLKEKYTFRQCVSFYRECACRLGDAVVSGERNKDKLLDACIIYFINTLQNDRYGLHKAVDSDLGMSTKEIYSGEFRITKDINIPLQEDIKNFILLSKEIFICKKEVVLSCGIYNNVVDVVKTNKHMHENLEDIQFSEQDVFNKIDEFLIFSGKCRGVEIDKADLKRVEEDFKLLKSKEK